MKATSSPLRAIVTLTPAGPTPGGHVTGPGGVRRYVAQLVQPGHVPGAIVDGEPDRLEQLLLVLGDDPGELTVALLRPQAAALRARALPAVSAENTEAAAAEDVHVLRE